MKKTGKILIVDDEPNILLSLDFLMRRNGHVVFIARNGTEAMEILGKETPNLVLLDIMMPDVDGYQICSHIKSTDSLSHTKVIFLSAKSKESDVQYGLSLGADAYLTKPFSTRTLTQKIEELL
jgi:DNA-binding response OmpR family regulator